MARWRRQSLDAGCGWRDGVRMEEYRGAPSVHSVGLRLLPRT